MSFKARRNSGRFGPPLEFATEEQRDAYDYLYDLGLEDTRIQTLAWGIATRVAVEHPDWTFWQVVAELRQSLQVTRSSGPLRQ